VLSIWIQWIFSDKQILNFIPPHIHLKTGRLVFYSSPKRAYPRRGSGEGGADLFSLGSSDVMCKNGSELHQGRFRLDIRKHFFTKRVVKHRDRLPREAVDVPSLSLFKRHLDNALNIL